MCKGSCKVQIYDVSPVDVNVTLVKGQKPPCPEKPYPSEIADHLLAYSVTVEGCDDAKCECIPLADAALHWSKWASYSVPKDSTLYVERFSKSGGSPTVTICEYELTGQYWVSSAVVDGVCQDKPRSQERLTNPNRPEAEKPVKKAPVKKN
jgi:hypothetical protein